MRKLIASIVFGSALATLAGCASNLGYDASFYETQAEKLKQVENFSLSGKIAIKEKTTKLSSYLNITAQGNDYTIYLTSLTGSTIMKLVRKQGVTELTDDKGKVYTGDNSEELVYKLTGLHLPCDALKDLVRAIPNNLPYTKNEDGSIATITSDSFTATYNSYQNVGSYVLPEKINITGPELTIRIKINEWEI